jgi:hypothetical protein
MKRETFATEEERDAAVGHVAAQGLMEVELPVLEPPATDREDVLDALGEALHHLPHLADLLLGEVVEALLEQRLAPELLHVVVVLLLELALGEGAHAAPRRLEQPVDQVAQRGDLLGRHARLFEARRQLAELVTGALDTHLLHGAAAEEADLEEVLDVLDPGGLRGGADQLLELIQISEEHRPG